MNTLFIICSAKGSKNRYRSPFVLCVLLLVIFLFPLINNAAPTSISARYQQAEGTQVIVEINIGSSTPSSLILVQRLPTGVNLLDATPPANNINFGKGEIKWLLRDLKPGKIILKMTLEHKVTASQIEGEIRYKPSNGGGMQIIPVKKP